MIKCRICNKIKARINLEGKVCLKCLDMIGRRFIRLFHFEEYKKFVKDFKKNNKCTCPKPNPQKTAIINNKFIRNLKVKAREICEYCFEKND